MTDADRAQRTPAPTGRRPTINDVASMSGVSKATVSHVLNGSRYVSETVQSRVLAAMRQLNYSPNQSAAGLRNGRTNTIGVIVPSTQSPLSGAIQTELGRLATEQGLGLLIAESRYSHDQEREWISTLAARRVDVLLVWPVGDLSEELRRIHDAGQPIVQIVSDAYEIAIPSAVADFRMAGALGVRHLVQEHGATQVVALVGRRHSALEALEGSQTQAAELGIPLQAFESDDTAEAAADAATRAWDATSRGDSILALTAQHLEALLDLRVRGENLSDRRIVAMSDQAWLRHLTPSVTAIRQDAHSLAVEAITATRRLIDDPASAPTKAIIPPRLIRGTSCGCEALHEDEGQIIDANR